MNTKGVSGTVQVQILVGADGGLDQVKISQGLPDHPELDKAALAAARQCEFTAGTVDGEPAAMWMRLPFDFKLE